MSHTFLRFLAAVAVVHIAAATPTTLRDRLPGEYRRSFDLEALTGVNLTLRGDGSFVATASGNVAKMRHLEIKEGEIGSASGRWDLVGNELHLVPTSSSGVLVNRFLKYRIEQCDGSPALLPEDEVVDQTNASVGVPQSRFARLLLKERVMDATTSASRSKDRKLAEQNWAAFVPTLLDTGKDNSTRFVGTIVMFQGERTNTNDPSELEIKTKVNGSWITCRVHNSIDGTRLAEFWPAVMVEVSVRGEIVSIDHAKRTVEVRPLEASPLWAR